MISTDRPHSIAMVVPCAFPGNYGTPAAIREMSEALADRGHRVHVVTYPFADDAVGDKVRVWRVPYWRKRKVVYVGPSFEKLILDLLLLLKLCRVIRREKVEIIHAHAYEGALIGFLARLITGRPMVYHAHNLMADELHTYGFLKSKAIVQTAARLLDWLVPILPDRIITITRELRDRVVARGIAPERVAYVPAGVDTKIFDHGDPERFRRRYSLGSRPVVMYTGTNNAYQRIDYLLRAFRVVLENEPAAVLMVVSGLSEEADLPANQALARSLGIAESVIWVDSQKFADLPDYLALASVTVVPRPEVPGYPIKLVNYMAAGTPIVCFEGAAKEVRHLHDALLVPDHDWRQMGNAIIKLLREREDS
jgi:glycosyltransferase involved in cell wall biosynthesis